MKHKTWFRLVLKAIGIFLLATGVVDVVDAVSGSVGRAFFSGGFGFGGLGSFDELLQALGFALYTGLVGGIGRLVIGAYLLFGGAKLVNLCIPSNRPYCPHCGYDVRGVGDEVCPECGVRLPADLFAASQREAEVDRTELDEEPLPKRTGFTRFVPPRNGRALIGYYFAIASLIPILGVVLGPIAVFNGVEGIRHARQFPEHGGGAHGIVAVTLGSLTTVANLLGLCLWPLAILQ